MELELLKQALSVCQVESLQDNSFEQGIYFIGKTEEELSLVCETQYKPEQCLACEDGWRAFKIKGVLEFSLVGILSKISTVLADAGIGIFAISTYNTDYVLVKKESVEEAARELMEHGYKICSL